MMVPASKIAALALSHLDKAKPLITAGSYSSTDAGKATTHIEIAAGLLALIVTEEHEASPPVPGAD